MPARIVLARMELNGLGKDKLTNIAMIIIVARSVYTPIRVLDCDFIQLCTYDGHSWKAINLNQKVFENKGKEYWYHLFKKLDISEP